jgi:alkylation response protein AidB-like acyl-CoA dehydrogenase
MTGIAYRVKPELGESFGSAQLAALDRAEAFPDKQCGRLDELGTAAYHVPAEYGGALSEFPELIRLWRGVAGRDLTVAIGYAKTYLGCVPVWLAGHPEQARALASRVRGGAVVSWGLSERDHGADLIAGELTATAEPDGWRLDGEKWLINNATRADLVCLLARTGTAGGARGFSLFLVHKADLAASHWRTLPKVRTHGIRGADISGIAFDGARIPAGAVVGQPGAGIETVLSALQLTRTVCAALSLGAMDHALRLGLRYTAQRRLYGHLLHELPQVRATLARAGAALLLAEAVSTVAARGVHALTGELSVLSAVTKALVPALAASAIREIGELLGARSFLIDEYADGMFQKVDRDHRIVGVFDGSTAVNRAALIAQFPVLARRFRQARVDQKGLTTAVDLTQPLAPLDPARLSLMSRTGCSLMQSLPALVAQLRGVLGAHTADRILREATELHDELAAYRPVAREVPAAAFWLARRYERCVASAACLSLWLRNQERLRHHPLWIDALWLHACLDYLAGRPDPDHRFADLVRSAATGDTLTLFPPGDRA